MTTTQRAKGEPLLPRVANDSSPPSRQTPGKGAQALVHASLLPHSSSHVSCTLAFLSGAILMLVVALATGTVQWQGVSHNGLMGGLLLKASNGAGAHAGNVALQAAQAQPSAAGGDDMLPSQSYGKDSAAAAAAAEHADAAAGAAAAAAAIAAAKQAAVAECPKSEPCPTKKEPCRACPKQQACPTKPQAAPKRACPACTPCATCPEAAAPSLPPPPPPQKAMPWKALLSLSEVQRGLSYYGTGERLRAVVAKLQAGRPIKAFTLGGSVTKGQGATSPEAGYASRFFEFINATWPHKDHVLVNKGIGGTSSGVYSACAEQMVGKDQPDLIILEFTVNERADEPFSSSHRRGYEELLRKLLRLPGPPAVIQMHHYSWWRAVGDGVKQGLYYFPQAEGQLTVFSQYYDVPSVSLRSAVYHNMLQGVPGFKVDKVWEAGKVTPAGVPLEVAGKDERHLYFYNDRTHPNDRGHQMMAELLAAAMLRAAAEHSEGWEQAAGQATGWAPERQPQHAGQKEAQQQQQQRRLPPPMIPGNADVPTSLCAIQEGFKDVVVAHSKGFEWRPERPEEATFVGQKWGWTATTPGAWAELEFDSRNNAAPNSDLGEAHQVQQAQQPAEVYLSHLKGYEGMGTAKIKCVSGCVCGGKGSVLDGTWEPKATLMQIHRFQVTQHEKCRVRVTVLKKPGEFPQEGHKVSMMAIMVSHFLIRLKTFESQAEEVANLV